MCVLVVRAGAQEEVEGMMVSEFTSKLINELKDKTYTMQRGDITIKLAKKFGFCWGVERAVAMAYEARKHFPTEVSSRPQQCRSERGLSLTGSAVVLVLW